MKPHGPFIALAIALLSIAAPATESNSASTPEAEINALILRGDFDEATARLVDLVGPEDTGPPALRLRLARLLMRSGEHARAAALCESVVAMGPETPEWSKAHFLAADAHAAQGDFAAAEALIHDRVVHLLSPERKAELAQIYIDHADALFDPEDDDRDPDFGRARFFYEQAIELGLGAEQARTLRHRVGQCWVELENWREVVNVYRALVEQLEDEPLHTLRLTALFELGRGELRSGLPVDARHHLRRVIREATDLPMREIVEVPEVAEATRLLPETFGGTSPASDVMLRLTVQAYEDFVAAHPDHEEAEQARLAIAQAHRHRGRTAEAVAAVERFLREHSDGELAPDARILLGELHGAAHAFDDARTAWNDFLRRHPTNPRWTEMQRRLVDLDFQEARHHFAQEEWDEAQGRLTAFIEAYPLDARQAEALLMLGRIEEEQERWEEALTTWADLAEKHPGTEPARQSLMRSARIADRELGDMARARDLLRRASEQGAPTAQSALTQMENAELIVETEHAFRPGETPQLHIVTRNIESLACEAYAIDLETYFRAKHTLAGVADLDIALIDPDVTWEHAVEDYEEFRVFERDLDLPLEGAGAWAIRLATEDLEATTLVLVTDLALITKASRNQALIFAQRWADPAAAPGVRVLLSDGEEIFAELETGDDGTVIFDDDESLRDLSTLRVLVTDGISVACSELDLQSVQHVEGRQPRGFLWSAKPVYQPGQTARVAGIIRIVEAGRYTFAEGEEWQVSVADSRGQMLMADTVTLDDFGGFDMTIPLPPTVSTGQCTVTVTPVGAQRAVPSASDAGPTFTGSFLVDRYQIDETQLVIELPRRVVVRGETIAATVTLRRYTGEPVRGARIEYQLQGDFRHEGVTDDSGRLEIELPTDELAGEGPQPLRVTYTEENLAATEVVILAETAVEAAVTTVRAVHLAEETFEVTVETTDVEGEPIGVEGELTVLRVTEDGGEVPSGDPLRVRTDAETGIAHLQISAAEGGLHRLRAEGVDAEGRPWTAQGTVTISDDDDEIRLRLLADRDTFRAGEQAELTVVNRTDARLALATWEADRALRHEVIDLRGGRSEWTFPLSADDSPTVTAALSLVDGTEMHTADHALRVESDLVITVEPETDIAEPGAEVLVRVTAHDPAGNPVAARLGLAMVDQALLARHPDATPDIGAFFYGAAREHTVRTGTSADFSYAGQTHGIAQALLAERQLLQRGSAVRDADFGDRLYAGIAPASEPAPVMASRFEGDFVVNENTMTLSVGEARSIDELRQLAVDDYAIRIVDADASGAGRAELEISSLGFSDAQYRGFGDIDGEVFVGGRLGVSSGGLGGRVQAPRRNFVELAFFDPTVTTDESGEATVMVPLADNMTRWRLVARGTTHDTLVGGGEGELTTRRDFYVSVQAPARLTEGDRVFLPVRVHNLTDEDLEANLTVRVTQDDGRPINDAGRRRVTVPANDHVESLTEFQIELPRDLDLSIEAEAGDLADALEQSIPVAPWGIQVATSRGGVARGGERTLELSLENARGLIEPTLTIELYPRWEDALLTPLTQRRTVGPVSVAGRALVDVALLDHLAATARSDDARYDARRLALQGAVAQLQGSQGGDGGWPWVGTGNADLFATAQSVRALVGARRHGVWVDPAVIDRGVAHLQAALRRLNTDDLAMRADVQHALAVAGRADFAVLHALHRERNRLDVRSLALLALALDAAERPEMAGEIGAILSGRFTPTDDPIVICWEADAPFLGASDNLETTALALLALQVTQGLTDQVESGIRFLMDRLPTAWRFSDRASAAAAFALARYHTQTRPAAARLEINVLVDGDRVETVRWWGAPLLTRITLGEGEFDPARVRIDLRAQGDSDFAYLASLTAFQPGIEPSDMGTQGVWLEREYLQAERRHGGRAVPRGRSVVEGRVELPTNEATAVGLGEEVIVHVRHWRHHERMPDAHVIVEEPLPLGTRVVEGSLQGNFVHSEVLPDRIRLHIDMRNHWHGDWRYRLRGAVPGEWRVLPTTLTNVFDPGQSVRGNPAALRVLREGEESPDTYELSPDEHYHLGLWLAEEGRHAEALEHLVGLFDERDLHANAEREVALQILESAIALESMGALPMPRIVPSPSDLIVRFFEVLHERHPDVVLSWGQTIAVAEAYRAREEYERAWQVLRGAAEASFLRDSQVAGVLEAQGSHGGAIEHMDRLIATYPDLPSVQSALLALAGAVEAKANDESLRAALEEEGIGIAEMHEMALRRFEQFLADHPDHPRAPEATLTLATLWLDLERRTPAVTLCEALRRRWPDSPDIDDAIYLQAYAHFLEGEDDQSLALCARLAEDEFPTPGGSAAPSPNRPQAHYITAQIRHAVGDPAGAIEAYRLVEDRFPDAAQAIEHFTRHHLTLPEITNHGTGESATVTLTTRNLDDVHVRVFRVDLMTLTLLRRSLDQVVDIDLAGITPTLDQTVAIGAADDYADAETEVEIGVDEPGAYLVVAAGENLLASGLVVVTDLELEVQEDPTSGRVRANVTGPDGLPIADADVRVVGQGNEEFRAGQTDRRGIFVADAVTGVATVLVRSGDQWAFHRGAQALGGAERWAGGFEMIGELDVLGEQLRVDNFARINRGQAEMQTYMHNVQAGVDLYRVQQ